MAVAVRAQKASSSMSRCTYHIFLSFRGHDTRKHFIDHLYTALVQAGIHTFRDNDEMEVGENIQAELQKAIKESKISIIVFSKDYASSRWCLDELVMIMERRRIVGHTVVPIFYDVDPSQVRKQTGSYAKAFARHKKHFKKEMHMVERWRAALKEVADLAGMVSNNRPEAQFIQDIVREIQKELYRPVLNIAPHLVGIDSRVKDINWWLQDGSSDVGIAIIFGIGGIGKTTIAKTVYNQNFERFQGKSFLANVRDTSKVRLQSQLLSDLLNGQMNKVYNVDEGIMKIKDALCCKKVLIVLDDVDQMDQFDTIIGMRDWLYPGSKIIMTTRHTYLLRGHKDCVKFKVTELDDNESLQLFSWHAFRQGHPIEGYMECSRKVVDRCGGLPLALKILGSSLFGESINVWKSALQKLEAILDNKIQEVLKISYDSLQDVHDKNLFLDIACFFLGEDKNYTVAILDRCGFYTTVGIQNLINRCLLTINEGNKLIMHQLLKDMGREIIRQESTDDPGKRSRLCDNKIAFTVLKEKIGTQTIKGLTIDLHRLMEDKHGKTIISENFAKRHHDEDCLDKSTIGNCSKRRRLGFFSWQPMNATSKNSFSLSNEVDLETKTFSKMHELKLLQLNYVKLRGNYEDFSKNLIWLCWHGFPLESLPTNFYLEKLVALDMCHSSLKHVWKGTRFLAELKFLNLSHSHGLVITPDFSGLPNLEKLMLEGCINLVKVDESVVNLDRLVVLNLEDCKNLRKLPSNIWLLKSFEELILSGCSKLDELPRELRKMESLKVLHVDGVSINLLQVATSNTNELNLISTISWHSTLWSWLSPTKTPRSTSFSLAFLPHCLVSLNLANCNLSDDAISRGFSSLPSLQNLNLSGNPFHSLPKSIKGLTMLKTLALKRCKELQSIPEFPNSLKAVMLHAVSLPGLMILGCEKLVEIEGVFKLEPLENADVTVLKSLGLSNLDSLRRIEVDISCYIWSAKRIPVQVLHECDMLSIFLPGSEIPSCFNLQSAGSSISFDVPPVVGHKIRGLNLCTVYEFDKHGWPRYQCARISNKTKCVRWNYAPICYATPEEDIKKDILWLSHWKIGDQLEGGDRIDVSMVFSHQVKMCGICLVYEPEDKDNQSTTEEIVRSAFPWYQTVTLTKAGANVKFCCHHSFSFHKYNAHPNYYSRNPYLTERNPQLELDTCFICDKFDGKY